MSKKYMAWPLVIMVLAFLLAIPVAPVHALHINIDGDEGIVKVQGDIYIGKERVVTEDVVAVMGDIRVDGKVRGDVVSVLGDIRVNGEIEGDAVAVLGDIIKGQDAVIRGDTVEARGLEDLDINLSHFGGFRWGLKFFNLILLFGAASLTLALIPGNIKTMTGELERDPWRKLLIGFLALLITPVVAVLIAITIIGIPLIPFLVLAFVIAKFVGYIAVSFFVGTRIKRTAGGNFNIFIELLLGIVILWLIRLIPVIGFISSLAVTMFALGLVIDTKFGTNRPWFKKKELSPPGNGEE